MNNISSEKTDQLLRAYFTREQNEFTYKEAKKHPIRYTSLVAAALVLLIFAGFFGYSALHPKNEFVISVAAAGTEEYTELSVRSFYTKAIDLNQIEPPIISGKIAAGVIAVDGETVADVTVRSEKGNGEFLKASAEGFYSLDSEGTPKYYGNKDSLYMIYSPDELSETERTSAIWYISTDKSGEPLSIDREITEENNDTVSVKIYFEDGTYETETISVTYSDGKMNMEVD